MYYSTGQLRQNHLSDFETVLLLERRPNLKQIKILMEPNTVHHKYYHQYIILIIGFIWPDHFERKDSEHTGMEPFGI